MSPKAKPYKECSFSILLAKSQSDWPTHGQLAIEMRFSGWLCRGVISVH